jgi:hypothetical protein
MGVAALQAGPVGWQAIGVLNEIEIVILND